MHGLLEGLSPPQKEAVTHGEGPLLVIAGAGSGKTRVITRRLAYLLSQGAAPWELLALTFTNKAAGEMKERVDFLTSQQNLWVSTFHSFCARLLRREIPVLGYTQGFSIFDTQDQVSLVRKILRDLQYDPSHFKPGMVSASISYAKNRLKKPEEVIDWARSLNDRVIGEVYRIYQERLRENNALDFDDLLLKVLELFEKHPAVAERYASRFRYILVDEYQDTNHPQYLILKILAGKRRNITATGDPDQSIYRWRGADINNILSFERDFPGARVIRLEENYRSTKRILCAASGLIQHNEFRKTKELWTNNPEGELLCEGFFQNEREEAVKVAEAIQRLIQEGREPDDLAIFYRINALSRNFERALMERGIPYLLVGAVAFYERKEIKDVLAYLRVLSNPRDDVSLERILNVPPRGLGKKTLEKLSEEQNRSHSSLWEVLCCAGGIPRISARAKQALERVVRMMDALKAGEAFPVEKILLKVLEFTGYLEYLQQQETDKELNRVENVQELVSAAAEYDRLNPEGSLQGFLEEVSLVSDIDNWDTRSGRVSLMTLHSAKGLEFPVVFIAGLEDGLLPHSRSMDSQEELEEERRLFFVGLTRAKEMVYLTYSYIRTRFGGSAPYLPSPFLSEIPGEVKAKQAWERSAIFLPLDEARNEEAAAEEGAAVPDLSPGDRVMHPYFGPGVVIKISGTGPQARGIIRFKEAGEKKLLLEYAKLEKL